MAQDFVVGMWAEAYRKAARAQAASWREFHSHCGHARNDEASILCDITEAYCTYVEEVTASKQRSAWRESEPRVRSDATRIERDHFFALEINASI